jgi:Right handed beta helix region
MTPLRQVSLSSVAFAVALACIPAHAGPRAFVASSGSNGGAARCTMNNPCRTFQAAHDAVDAGGEVVALDTAEYGSVIVTKSLSILGSPGAIAIITVATGSGVVVATPGINVVLRNLNITGVPNGLVFVTAGADMSAGNSLSIENCVFSNLTLGLRVTSASDVRIVNSVMRGNTLYGATISGGATVDVVRSQFMGNGASGFFLSVSSTLNTLTSASISDSESSGNGGHGFAASAVSGITRVSVIRSTAANNLGNGFHSENVGGVNADAYMSVGSSMASGNAFGFFNSQNVPGFSHFDSLGNNLVRQNTTDSSGGIATVPGL